MTVVGRFRVENRIADLLRVSASAVATVRGR